MTIIFYTGMSPVELFHSHEDVDEGEERKIKELQRCKKQEKTKKKKFRSGASIASKHTVYDKLAKNRVHASSTRSGRTEVYPGRQR